MDLTPRQHETLEIVKQLQPVNRRTIARTLQVREATAAQHLDALRRAGLIRPSYQRSRWVLIEQRDVPAERAIAQAASVWEYAKRMEMEAKNAR